MYRIFLLMLSLCVSAVRMAADNEIEINIDHITTRDGLPANSVRCVFQDSRGFLWLGTINNGLCKYDGKDFQVMYPTYSDSPGLADPRINSISEDNDGHLWIVTMSEQVSCYDLRQEKFVDYSGTGNYNGHYGHVNFSDDGIWLWGSAQGCMNIKYKDGEFKSVTYTAADNALPSDYVTCLVDDSDITWIGTTEGLCRHQDGKVERVVSGARFVAGERFADGLYFISKGGDIWKVTGDGIAHVHRIGQIKNDGSLITGSFSPDGKSWIIFTTRYAYRYNVAENSSARASRPYDLRNAEVMTDGKGNYLAYDKAGNVVFADAVEIWEKPLELTVSDKEALWTTRYGFVRTDDDMVWISSHENGLFAYDVKDDTLQHFSMDEAGNGNASDILMCVVEDNSGNLWIGSEFSGIFKVNVINQGASYLHFGDRNGNEYSDMVRMISTHDEDEVWVSTRDGKVYVYDPAMQTRKRTMRFDSNVYSVCSDDEGRLWIGTRGKGVIVDGKRYSHANGDPRSLSSDRVFDMVKDNDGDIWIGTFGGGINLAVRDGKGGYTFRSFFNDSYSRRHVRALNVDANGYLWVGTSNGIIVFNPKELQSDPSKYVSFNSYNHRLRSNECRAITTDSKGRVYVAETGVGFSICEPEDYSSLQFRHYSAKDGLVNGLVQGFVEDESGKMWVTTEYGISCFDPEKDDFRNFTFSSNMQSNVCLDNSVARLNDGRLLVGTNDGLAVIDPKAVPVNVETRINDVVLTSLTVQGVDIPSVSYTSDISLKHDQDSFSLSFSTLEFRDGVLYSYMLEGYDKDWSPASEVNEVTYRQIPPGDYVFRVRAGSTTGIWQQTPTSLNIVVKPPFYRTGVAYLIYVFLSIAALYLAFRLIRRMATLKNEAKVEKQLTEYKLMFFTNVSHEFRTPLTLILHSMEKLRRSQNLDEGGQRALKTMEAGTNRLMRLINQLLEFRKIQNNRHVLRLEETDVIRFCGEIFDNFKEAASAKRLDFQYMHSMAEYMMYLDQGDMDKVIYNLISNAVKYTPEGGRITLSVEVFEHDRIVKISVKDNGIGIPSGRRKDLFTRFAPGESSESSMGIGLHLTKTLVDANKGEIAYSENPEGGTVMTVTLPADKDVYAPEDFKEDGVDTELSGKEMTSDSLIIRKTISRKPVKPINPHKILVVDDEPDIRRLITDELKDYFNVIDVSDGIAALEILKSDEGIELVVCDVMMPGMSGYDVTARIKEDIATCHIPVILLTALGSDAKKLEGIQSGADAYITKPFNPDYILTRILKLLEQRNRLREKFSNDLSLKAEAICNNDIDREFMDKVDRILERQLSNPDFSMDDFASEMAMGRSSFYTKIHKVTGYSPNKYIRILRMKKAAELILTGKYTAAEVSYKVGIQDASYFGKSFREQFGISPKAYYKKATEDLNRDSNSGD